jgi:hypothetical protein
MKDWMLANAIGMPRWGWVLLGLLVLVEKVLGHSEDKRFRSVADSIRNLLGIVLESIPVAGPLLVRVLRAIYVVPKPAAPGLPLPPDK